MIDKKLLANAVIALLFAFALYGCESGEEPEAEQTAAVTTVSEAPPDEVELDSLRILFLGNSLTYYNNLPEMVEQLLDQAGISRFWIEGFALPNYGLPDHFVRADVRSAIADGDWDYVVLQQGPSATEGRPYLLEYAVRFEELIRTAGAEPAIYMVWPSQARFFDYDGVLDSYRTAAEMIDGIFLPAGQAWREAWAEDESLQLYGTDQFHPSPLGSYLAALVIFQGLTGLDPRELADEVPFSLGQLSLSADKIAMFQRIAYETNEKYGFTLSSQ